VCHKLFDAHAIFEVFYFAQLKGRAIQVEGGLGERVPSTDMARRPRALDSDVVIQVCQLDAVL